MKNFTKIILVTLVSLLTSFEIFSAPINQFINSVSPPMNANSVVKTSNIVITFEQVMNGSTMTDANVKVFGYQTGLMTVSLDFNSGANTLTINPVNDFKNGEKISVTLTFGIKTLSNQNITPLVYTFRVKAIGGTGSFVLSSEIINNTDGYIRSGDIDGDGDIDLVINNSVYKNNGNALFNISQTLNNQGRPDIFDADNDNDLDILMSNNGTINFYKNDGLGNFSLFSTFPGGVWAYGDLNGNGFIDISYFNNTNEVKSSYNNNGIFNPGQSYLLIGQCVNGGNYYDNLLIDEFNNDGSLDILAISGYTFGDNFIGYIWCRNYNKLSNYGNGLFNNKLIYTDFMDPSSVLMNWSNNSVASDFNYDGYIDLISPRLAFRTNQRDSLELYLDFNWFNDNLIFDFNGDEILDVAFSSWGSTLAIGFNDGLANFNILNGNSTRLAFGSAGGDFDNDGDIDIAFKEYNNDKVAILLNGDSPLPVELSSFTSSINLNSVKLNWTTSQEQNNSGFEVERSDNSSNGQEVWKNIVFINGSGNSNAEKNYLYEDKNLASGKYNYRLKQIDFNGNFEYHDLSNEVVIGIPASTELMQNYPNPFNPVTNISYRLSENGFVTLRVFDNSGREVKTLVNEFREAGYYTNEFNGNDLASGVYFYKLTAGDFTQTKKLSLVK